MTSDDYAEATFPPDPYDVSDGEMRGVAPVDVFALGVECGYFAVALDAGGPVTRMVRRANLSRVKRMCIRRGRTFRVTEFASVGIDVPGAVSSNLSAMHVFISVE